MVIPYFMKVASDLETDYIQLVHNSLLHGQMYI